MSLGIQEEESQVPVREFQVVEPDELAAKSGFSFDGDEDDNQEETQEAESQSAEEPKSPKVQPEKTIVNPGARLRIVEKEKKSLLKTNQELIERMARLEAAILKRNEPEPEEDPIPELDDDPWGRLDKKIDLVTRDLTKDKEQKAAQEELKAQVENVGHVLQLADQVIVETAPKLPGYAESNQYLADVLINHALELDWIEDEDQARQEVARWIHETKITNLANGKNPADHFYRMARYYGWDPNSVKQEETKEAKEETKKEDAREVIKKQREKENKSRTISNVPGSTAKTAIPFSKMTSEDLTAHFRQLKKSGSKSPYKNDPATASVMMDI